MIGDLVFTPNFSPKSLSRKLVVLRNWSRKLLFYIKNKYIDSSYGLSYSRLCSKVCLYWPACVSWISGSVSFHSDSTILDLALSSPADLSPYHLLMHLSKTNLWHIGTKQIKMHQLTEINGKPNEKGGGLSNQYLKICLCFVYPFEVGMVADDLQASLLNIIRNYIYMIWNFKRRIWK